ncbi:MAG TPA: response regulator [Gemmatimonadaceae bacterium]|nr:response regulator [Gemmatimonadaceae bacterium]
MLTDQLAGRLILIAERDRNVRDLQSFALEAAGFVVAFVDDGEAAFAYATSNAIALIITEILIPKLDGLTLCRRLRAEPATRHVPVLVFSILAAATRAEDAGARGFLRKPFIESSFIATVSQLTTVQDHVMTVVT